MGSKDEHPGGSAAGASEAASLPAAYFERMYAADPDPWRFATRRYEHVKYTDTLRSLPRPRYGRVLEVGCSIGVLTERLAARCARLLALDVAERALEQARARCAHLPHVRFERRRLPAEYPGGPFDLVVLSEVGYYWSRVDVEDVLTLTKTRLAPHGHLLLVHWTPEVDDYPLTGDEVHDLVHARAAPELAHRHGHRAPTYRLDLFEK